MKPIISVEGLGKSYAIRHEGQKTRYKSLREELFKLPRQLLQRSRQSQEEFWALKDVNFDVMPGDRVGIIGRNGAGKSTLLKLLSRITEPTKGRITLRGRVASLLEVGTGFHPELTGRENIFLNGAILGMSRAEVRRKFDEIVDFAGVEKFLDTPVKRYSSGMYVRLAFAVAAHLEPEILIVDEVLAVGDMEFQKKCLGKMEEVGKEGRTVLFVSHNMSAIKQLCSTGVLLDGGKCVATANISNIIDNYLEFEQDTVRNIDILGEGIIVKKIEIVNATKTNKTEISCDDLLAFRFTIVVTAEHKTLFFGVAIEDIFSNRIVTCHSKDFNPDFCCELMPGVFDVQVSIPHLHLAPGKYYYLWGIRNELNENIIKSSGTDHFNVTAPQRYDGSDGIISAQHCWNMVEIQK